jgi:hypothetical protein
VGEANVARLEPFGRCFVKVAHGVTDGDIGDSRFAHGAVDLCRGDEVEQRVRGDVVADRDTQVQQVVDGYPRRVAESAQPCLARRRNPVGLYVDRRGAVDATVLDAF